MAKKNKQQTELQMLDMYDKLKEFLVNPANHMLVRHSNQDKYHYIHYFGIHQSEGHDVIWFDSYTTLFETIHITFSAVADYHVTKLELIETKKPQALQDNACQPCERMTCEREPNVVLKLTYRWRNDRGRSMYLYLLSDPTDRDWKKYFNDGK